MSKNFVREPFNVSLISGIEQYYVKKGGENHDFPFNLFCLTLSKHFVEEPFSVSLKSGNENFFA